MQTLYRGSTNYIRLTEVFDVLDREYLDDATAVATVFDSSGTGVTGATAISVAHTPGTVGRNAEYIVEIAHTVSLPAAGTVGEVVVTVTSAAGKVRKLKPVPVRYEP